MIYLAKVRKIPVNTNSDLAGSIVLAGVLALKTNGRVYFAIPVDRHFIKDIRIR